MIYERRTYFKHQNGQGGLPWFFMMLRLGQQHNSAAPSSVTDGGKKRLTKLATAMAKAPSQSLPQQCGSWGDLKAAYRLLNHPKLRPEQITAVHREYTRGQAEKLGIVLCVQDTTDLDYTHRSAVRGLGKIGDGGGRGFRQHTAMAVSEQGQVLGILDQTWFLPNEPPEGETRRQRQARWNEPDVWGDTARGVGPWAQPSRLIHVGDRHSDVFRFLCICRDMGHGFLVRAMHNRYLAGNNEVLWDRLRRQPVRLMQTVKVGAQRMRYNRLKQNSRMASVTIRYSPVLLPPPRNDPRTAKHKPIQAWAIYVLEENSPAGEAPLEWMLLTSESVQTPDDAQCYLQWYRYRWVIEEWHRALKEGCRLERSQLDDVDDLQRLAALTGVLAVRMLQLRDLADKDSPHADDPAALRCSAPQIWIDVVSRLAGLPSETLTPKQFFNAIARRGGYLSRKNDCRPGWKTLWQGWYDIARLAEGAELMRAPPKCG
jgi:hypothetical protein